MSYLAVTGLVTRAVEYKDADLILSVYTEQEGVLTVTARGGRRQGSPHAAAAQVLCCSRLVLSEYRERLSLKEAEILEDFRALRGDLPAMALASYLTELAQLLEPEGGAFRLTLAALTALAKRPPALVKAAFELRALCGAGVDPTLDPALPEPEGDVRAAADFVRAAPLEKVFSFTLGEGPLAALGALCERYVLAQTGHPPPSLEYYLGLRGCL